jgi:hypothetical protein
MRARAQLRWYKAFAIFAVVLMNNPSSDQVRLLLSVDSPVSRDS